MGTTKFLIFLDLSFSPNVSFHAIFDNLITKLGVTYDDFLSQNFLSDNLMSFFLYVDVVFFVCWALTAMEVTSTVSELGLSQILREKIIVSNTQIFHKIIKIWREIRHLVKIWDPKIQKWLRYRLLNKKPKFCCTYLSRTLHPNF